MPTGVYERGLSPQDRFWKNVNKEGRANENMSRCWAWCGSKNKKGYGQLRLNNKPILAHRYSYSLHNPYKITLDEMDGCEVCHDCDNSECCNPEHLFLGNNQDNVDDKCNKNRQANGEQHGQSKLNQSQVIEIRNRYNNEEITHRKLAFEYGVNHTTIYHIINNNTWTHLTTPDGDNQIEL